jgi:O-methyltransferase
MFKLDTAKLLINRPNSTVDSSIISQNQIKFLISLLESVILNNVEGDVVEFGCYVGESSKYLRMVLDHYCSNKKLYVYDSFDGLPELSSYEENSGWRAGTLKTTEEVLLENFMSNGLKSPIITKAWFKDIPESAMPEKISFAFLDGDFYDSIHDSLTKIYHRLSKGSVIVLHDYERPDLPGVKAAVDNFISSSNMNEWIVFKITDQLGVIVNP